MNADEPVRDRCPLCRGEDYAEIDRVAHNDVWERMTKEFDAHFTAEVIATNTPAPEARLVQCARCGLRFFAPVHPGDGDFYQQLMRGIPYLGHRWEFEVVAGAVKPGQRVLDSRMWHGSLPATGGTRRGGGRRRGPQPRRSD
jgi:hypothetical protein